MFWRELCLRDFGAASEEIEEGRTSWKEEYQNNALLKWGMEYSSVPDEGEGGQYAFIFSEANRKIKRDTGKSCCPKVCKSYLK